MNQELNLDWLAKLVAELPEVPKQRRNLLEISGFPKWENVISNLLAFYFEKEDEHGFNDLFISSLLDIYESKIGKFDDKNFFDGDFSVTREDRTNNGKRIDILLKSVQSESGSAEWAIIIENKIDATLYNDLSDYWNHVEAKHKVGIVLSKQPVEIPQTDEHKFINILHQQLTEQVKQNLPTYYMNADDRHLLFLKEYILNIESMNNTKNQEEMEKILTIFQQNHAEIDKLKIVEVDLSKYIAQTVREVMSKYGFQTGASNTSDSAHFYADKNNLKNDSLKRDFDILNKFRFWISYAHLKKHNSVVSYFELWGKENTKYGKELRPKLKYLSKSPITLGESGNNDFFQIYHIGAQLPSDTYRSFAERLEEALRTEFFEKGFIETAVAELEAIIKKEKLA